MKVERFSVKTDGPVSFIDITREINKVIVESCINNGLVNVFIPHTTAGVTINENADPDVLYDLKCAFKHISPKLREFLHCEGNSDAHVNSSLVGCSVQIPLIDGELCLGVWQGVYFCEFDGPRTRKVVVSIIEG